MGDPVRRLTMWWTEQKRRQAEAERYSQQPNVDSRDPVNPVYSSPSDFDIVEGLTMEHQHCEWSVGHEYWEPPILTLKLVLRPQRVADLRRLLLTFSGVSHVQFREGWKPLMQLDPLVVLPNRPFYWVSEIEERLSFYCEDYAATLSQAPDPYA